MRADIEQSSATLYASNKRFQSEAAAQYVGLETSRVICAGEFQEMQAGETWLGTWVLG